jgi:hypothetical protein
MIANERARGATFSAAPHPEPSEETSPFTSDDYGDPPSPDLAAALGVAANRVLAAPEKSRDKTMHGQAAAVSVRLGEDISTVLALLKDRVEALSRPDLSTKIQITTEEWKVNERAIKALATAPEVFVRGRRLVTVAREAKPPRGIMRSPGAPIIAPLGEARVAEILSRVATFEKFDSRERTWKPTTIPMRNVAAIHARGDWPGVRPLTAITETPVLRADGTVLEAPGWDEETGLLYEPSIPYPKVPEHPSDDELQAARELIEEVFCDFPFESREHYSAALSGVLTPLCRWAFQGDAPLHLIDANTRGAGKTRLADTFGALILGRGMARSTPTDNHAEEEKRLLALALAGDPLVLIDNIPQNMPLGTAALDAAMTSGEGGISNRVLGKNNEMARAPWTATVYATGTNVVIREDTLRRVLHIRLSSPLEKPEDRTGFRHELPRWAKENRARLVVAFLTLARAWYAAGRPAQGLKPWGSFEAWSSVVREILVFAGYPDPIAARQGLEEKSSPERDMLSALLEGWAEVAGGEGLKASDALKKVRENDAESSRGGRLLFPRLREAFGLMGVPARDLPSPKRLGAALEANRKKVLGGRLLDGRKDRKGFLLWRVVALDSQPAESAESCRDSVDLNARNCQSSYDGQIRVEQFGESRHDSADSAGGFSPEEDERDRDFGW